MVLRKAHRVTVNQGGTADIDLFALDRNSVKGVFYSVKCNGGFCYEFKRSKF